MVDDTSRKIPKYSSSAIKAKYATMVDGFGGQDAPRLSFHQLTRGTSKSVADALLTYAGDIGATFIVIGVDGLGEQAHGKTRRLA